MSISASNVTINNMVFMNGTASLPTMVPGMDPAKSTSWAEMHLAQGNKFPEEKSDATTKLADGNLDTEEELEVMDKVGTPVEYPVPLQAPPSQKDVSSDSLSLATHPAVKAKRNRRQVLLDLLYYAIETKNLAALYRLRRSAELNRTLRNMIEMAILDILCSRQTSRSNNCYLTRAVMADRLLATFNKVELWKLVQDDVDFYQLILDKRNSDAIETRARKRRRTKLHS